MKVYTNIDDFKGVKNPVVTTGMFDGVHLGHQKIITRLKEIAQENNEIFLKHGGEKFSFIPCLNDSDAGIGVLTHVIKRELQGWV